MTHVREIMSRDVVHVKSSSTIREAAGPMARYDIGALPVCDGRKMVGMVTDRDLAVRAIGSPSAHRRSPRWAKSRQRPSNGAAKTTTST